MAYRPSDTWLGLAATTTAADGTYTLAAVPVGEQRILFLPPLGSGLLQEWFDDSPTRAAATPLTVTAGASIEDVDAQLARPSDAERHGHRSRCLAGGGRDRPRATRRVTGWQAPTRRRPEPTVPTTSRFGPGNTASTSRRQPPAVCSQSGSRTPRAAPPQLPIDGAGWKHGREHRRGAGQLRLNRALVRRW